MKRLAFLLLATLFVLSVGAQDTMMKADKPAGDGSMMKADPSAFDLKGLGRQVVPFTKEQEAWTLAGTQTVVYYFAATWCPDCQATYRDLKAHWSQIPPTLTLVFVNYDKSADLKKKYGVTVQHTFVVIGPQGEKIKAWTGPTSVADLVKNARKG